MRVRLLGGGATLASNLSLNSNTVEMHSHPAGSQTNSFKLKHVLRGRTDPQVSDNRHQLSIENGLGLELLVLGPDALEKLEAGEMSHLQSSEA